MKRKTKHRQTRLKTKLGLPDLEHAKVAVIVSLRSFESQRSYRHSIRQEGPGDSCFAIGLWPEASRTD
jgi:hypothetical protein